MTHTVGSSQVVEASSSATELAVLLLQFFCYRTGSDRNLAMAPGISKVQGSSHIPGIYVGVQMYEVQFKQMAHSQGITLVLYHRNNTFLTHLTCCSHVTFVVSNDKAKVLSSV